MMDRRLGLERSLKGCCFSLLAGGGRILFGDSISDVKDE